jgi:Ca2+-binding RTX toxin-like protein
MRRGPMLLATMALMVSLFAAVAYAATIEGTDQSEYLLESSGNDTIFGHGGIDAIDAEPFREDKDKVYGNKGSDEISVEDGDGLDKVNGGKGQDRCFGDPGDNLDCEEENPITGSLGGL